MITFITPTQGNPIALKRTLESLEGIISEVIIGSVCIFDDDADIMADYGNIYYDLRVVKLPFNYIFHSGFSNTLNFLADQASNDLVLYMNVGEVIEKGKADIINSLDEKYNCYYLDHSVENHRWYRLYNRHQMRWDGIIHEEIVGNHRPYPKPIFTFADTEKDSLDKFKAKCYNDIKELVYFNLYKQLVDYPNRRGVTHEWWQQFAKENYESMVERLEKKGSRYEAFKKGDMHLYLSDILSNSEFKQERFESNTLVEFQGSRKSL